MCGTSMCVHTCIVKEVEVEVRKSGKQPEHERAYKKGFGYIQT